MKPFEIIGHKGAGEKGHPEAGAPNSEEALAWGLANGADRVECDLAISADGALFIQHDPTLPDIDGQPKLVNQMTLEEIERANGPRVTLARLLERLPDGRFNLELKRHTDYRRIFESFREAAPTGEEERFRFLSFEFDALIHVKEIQPKFECAYIATCIEGRFEPFVTSKHIRMCQNAGVEEISGHILSFRPRKIEEARRAGLIPSVGFVNTQRALGTCRKRGVTRLYTDAVPELRGWIQALEKNAE